MSDLTQLNTSLLLEQSQEMLSLKAAYESLFANITSDLNGINSSWSDLLSNNFTGKITSAQKSFTGALNMLQNSAGKAALVANSFAEFDIAQALKISGVGGSINISTAANMLLNLLDGKTSDQAQQILSGLSTDPAVLRELFPLSSSVDAWGEEIVDKILEKVLGKENAKIIDGIIDAAKGDYDKALKKAGIIGMKEFIRAAAEVNGVTLSSSDLSTYANYTANLVENVTEAYVECMLGEPTIDKALNFAWACTGEPILDTAGKTIYDTINLIPGVSEYWAEKDVTDMESMGNIALQEYYRLVTGSDEAAEYAGNYYVENNGLGGGITNLGSEIISFVKDSGGLGKAIENFGKTAIKDLQDVLEYRIEVEKMCWSSILGF